LPPRHATGALDRATVEALRKFQADRSLAKTGFPDRETVRQLGLEPKEVLSAGLPVGSNDKRTSP
jgi:hypothetical protein